MLAYDPCRVRSLCFDSTDAGVMLDSDVLHPLDVDNVVDVPVLIDAFGWDGKRAFVDSMIVCHETFWGHGSHGMDGRACEITEKNVMSVTLCPYGKSVSFDLKGWLAFFDEGLNAFLPFEMRGAIADALTFQLELCFEGVGEGFQH